MQSECFFPPACNVSVSTLCGGQALFQTMQTLTFILSEESQKLSLVVSC